MQNEYPKALYKGGKPDAEHVIVEDAEAEAEQRKAGYLMAYEKAAEKPAKTEKATK